MFQAACLLVLATSPATSHDAWDVAVQQRIATVAAQLMPPALANQLVLHADELKAGVWEPRTRDEPEEFHALHADGQYGRAAQRVEQQVTKIVTLLGQRVPFDQVVREFGVLSHYVSDTAWPLATSDADPREARYADDIAGYVSRQLKKFPPVFDGYYPFNDKPFVPAEYLQGVAEQANRYYPLLARAYFPDGAKRMVSSRRFDDRHPAFGISQLSYNHAVSAVANVWLFVWREAHGDMTGKPPAATAWSVRAQDPSSPSQHK